jgi:predicted RNA-binding Zn-ribbon protein involved in translation (DUF1610 family)
MGGVTFILVCLVGGLVVYAMDVSGIEANSMYFLVGVLTGFFSMLAGVATDFMFMEKWLSNALKEAYAGTGFASLEWTDEWERAIDKVAASGKIDPLGVLIWKAKYLLEAKAYQDAITGLTARYRHRYKPELPGMAQKLVEQALSEFLGPVCQTCQGTASRMLEGLKVMCPTCGGTTLKRYTDEERSGRMQLSLGLVKRMSSRLSWLAGELGGLDREVGRLMAIELERDK